MFVRVARGSSDPSYDDIVGLADDFVEAFKRLPGFVSYQTGVDRSTGAFISISTWETADAANFSRDDLGDVLQRLVALGARPDAPGREDWIVAGCCSARCDLRPLWWAACWAGTVSR
jgi:hypothetical protein